MSPGEVKAFVVMPDHVHVLYLSAEGERLSKTLQALKSASAHRLARQPGRLAPIWQHETFDRLIRTDREFQATWRYIEANPVRQGLVQAVDAYEWSSAWRRSPVAAPAES
jgi:REP element-mobilizing transposase RayT